MRMLFCDLNTWYRLPSLVQNHHLRLPRERLYILRKHVHSYFSVSANGDYAAASGKQRVLSSLQF